MVWLWKSKLSSGIIDLIGYSTDSYNKKKEGWTYSKDMYQKYNQTCKQDLKS